ncbi:hypothetical protein BCR34DRAFT_534040 [Clohesyomyces aquaticus]|uniref:Glucose-methanol-choline oxidoreductase N-terminal domain-containing protein n=1 Tax=Clohesyomyces aquaticus TaxID=1231657 RepID=A0A1Y1ZWQ0_9PLEO|nr:hypothetical protein BCR34DRAFT_534040 [Clohesyomyces aquaticus]
MRTFFLETILVGLFTYGAASPTPRSTTTRLESDWDVIIVGAGPAGIVVADRMSEAGKRTLLLEQGGPSYYVTGGRDRPHWLNGTKLSRVDVPGLYKSIFAGNENLTCGALLNAYCGCTVGGSTAINAGLLFQPPASDFDLYFPENWKSVDVQDAIAKLRAKQPFTDNPSEDGIRYLQSGYTAAREWIVDGAGYEDVQFNSVPDQKTKVFGHPEFNYVGGQRSGPTKTYLQSALQRPNFQLMIGARVTHVLRDGDHATGVSAIINSTEITFSLCSQGRVILSGGSLFTPQLLMKSGIGDPSALMNLSQNGLLDLPPSSWINNTAVGDKLFDNPNTFIELSSPSISSYVYSYNNPPIQDRDLYLQNRSGPFTFASETGAFWNTIAYAGEITGVQGTIDSSGSNDFTDNNTITLNVYGTSGMRSLGRVVLDKNGTPGPNANFFYSDAENRDAQDVATFIHDIFQALPTSLTPQNIPRNISMADLVEYVSTPSPYAAQQVQHWSSSCRLGTCVDTNTQVIGMQNLFVVDSSIVPPLTTNPVFGIMIAAERASELILALG